MRIAACIVLFHPDPKDLERDIRAIAPYLDTLILWRNSEEEISLPQDIPCLFTSADIKCSPILHVNHCIQTGKIIVPFPYRKGFPVFLEGS